MSGCCWTKAWSPNKHRQALSRLRWSIQWLQPCRCAQGLSTPQSRPLGLALAGPLGLPNHEGRPQAKAGRGRDGNLGQGSPTRQGATCGAQKRRRRCHPVMMSACRFGLAWPACPPCRTSATVVAVSILSLCIWPRCLSISRPLSTPRPRDCPGAKRLIDRGRRSGCDACAAISPAGLWLM